MHDEKVVLDHEDIRRTLVRIAHEIVEELVDAPLPLGDIDISFYRDDVGIRPSPVVHASHIEFPVDPTTVVLVDDVLYTGRTVRAAIDALFDYGRPQRVQLAALSDRVNVRVEELDGVDEVTIGAAPVPATPQEVVG